MSLKHKFRTNKSWRWIGGWAAIVGAMCWVVKGGLILLTGNQPPLLFEIAPAFFAVAIVGMVDCVNGRSRLAQIGVGFAVAGGVAALFNSVRELAMIITSRAISEIELFSVLAGFGWLLGLLLVGIPVWRQGVFSDFWRRLPVITAVSAFPLIVLFSILGEIVGENTNLGERMIEIPLILIGLAWIGIGWQLLSVSAQRVVLGE